MKKLFYIAFFAFAMVSSSFTFAAYDPGDLINAVKRSQIITELFMERWGVTENSLSLEELEKLPLQERFYYINRGGFSQKIDVNFHGETIFGYPVVTPFGQYDLSLFRIFGSAIVRFDNLADFGIFNWGLALSAAGYRYGMKKTITLNNSGGLSDPPVGSFSVSDYLYAQIFDDLVVVSNIFKPFGYLHFGMLFNKQVDPGPDGILDTQDDIRISSKARIFINSNLFNFLLFNLGYNAESDSTEYTATKIDVFSFLSLLGKVKNRFILPDIFLGYSYREQSEKSKEHTFFIELFYNYYNAFYIKGKTEFFLWGRGLLEKDSTFKQNLLEIGFRLDSFTVFRNPEHYYEQSLTGSKISDIDFSYYFLVGVSYLVNERSIDFGNSNANITGVSLGVKFVLGGGMVGGAIEARMSYNYSEKLYHLIEAYNHWIAELSLQVGF